MASRPLGYGPLSEEEFIALYPLMSNRELCALTGLTPHTIGARAHKLGLRKARWGASGGPGPKSTPDSRSANFWSHVDKSGDCWLWTGARLPNGYGKFGMAGHTYTAHRASWLLTHGELPKDRCVLHRCDVPDCVRPDHLFLGTLADNMADALSKNRLPAGDAHYLRRDPTRVRRGEATGHNRLTATHVQEIRQRHAAGERVSALAAAYGVSMGAIYHVVRHRTWTHLP